MRTPEQFAVVLEDAVVPCVDRDERIGTMAALLAAWRDEAVEEANQKAAKQMAEFLERQADDEAARQSPAPEGGEEKDILEDLEYAFNQKTYHDLASRGMTNENDCLWDKSMARLRALLARAPRASDSETRLRQLIDIQGRPGTIDQGDYMVGMYNGMLVALACLTGEEPQFKDRAPRADGWISVKERLPDDMTPVVVVYRSIRTKGIITCIAQWLPTIGRGEWRTTERNSTVEPTHWQPLPEPPKEEA